MGFSFRKSIKLGPARVNLSKSGVGFSVGAGGLRYTKSPKRKTKHKKSTTAGTSSAGSSSRSHQTPVAAHSSLKRSWFNAIFLAVFGFLVVAVISFIAVIVVCAVISMFVDGFMSTAIAKIMTYGLPIVFAALAARFSFLQYRPIKNTPGTNE